MYTNTCAGAYTGDAEGQAAWASAKAPCLGSCAQIIPFCIEQCAYPLDRRLPAGSDGHLVRVVFSEKQYQYNGIATRETLVSRAVSAHLTPIRFRYRLPDVAEAVVAGSEPTASGTSLLACYQ